MHNMSLATVFGFCGHFLPAAPYFINGLGTPGI